MEYSIAKFTLANNSQRDIDQATFEEVKDAARNLLNLLQIEQIYDVVVQNYLDLEKGLVGTTIDFTVTEVTERTAIDAQHRFLN